MLHHPIWHLLKHGTNPTKIMCYKYCNFSLLQRLNGKVTNQKYQVSRHLLLCQAKYCTSHDSPKLHSAREDVKINNQKDCNELVEEIDRVALIQLEIELYRQEGCAIPSVITESEWKELASFPSRRSRQKYLNFLMINEYKELSDKKKKAVKRVEREAKLAAQKEEEDEGGHIKYGLWHNSIFQRISDITMNKFYNNRLMSAMMYGQPLVIDLGYDKNMTSREHQATASQLQMLFADNRLHQDPFDLWLCNAYRTSPTVRKLTKYIPTLYENDFPINITEKTYLDIYNKNQLVYLTPHCREEMTSFDHDAIYIIGAIVDTVNSEPLSLAKAKREGIRMQKLPFDRYLEWGSGGGKSLTLNQMICIMLEMKNSGDWNRALCHVPRRKIRRADDEEDFKETLRKELKRKRRLRNFYEV